MRDSQFCATIGKGFKGYMNLGCDGMVIPFPGEGKLLSWLKGAVATAKVPVSLRPGEMILSIQTWINLGFGRPPERNQARHRPVIKEDIWWAMVKFTNNYGFVGA